MPISVPMTRQFELLTDWYLSVIENIRPEDGRKALTEHNNSLEWLAGHLLLTRGRNVARLGQPAPPFEQLAAFVSPTLPPPGFRPFSPRIQYPGLEACASAWVEVSRQFLHALETASEQVLRAEIPLQGPTGGSTVEDLLVAAVLHESFHIGQMSIIRKALGYPAMHWFRRS
jgi:hypothetical protein